MKSFFKAFFTTIFIVVILGAGLIGLYLYSLRKNEDAKNLNDFQFLVLGVDSLDSKKAENTRSDTIMVVNFNLENNFLNIISIPRDTYAEIQGYKKQKINHSYAYGGSELTLDSVNKLLGTDIKYYMTIDYKFVMDIVNAMGGVEVNVPLDMDYDDPTADPPLSIHIKEGQQVLKGQDAVGFLRFRKGYKSGSDLERLGSQQAFLAALFSQMKNPKTLVKAPLLYKAYLSDTQNNIPKSLLLKLAVSGSRLSMENVKATTLPGYPKYINKTSYFIMDENQAHELLKATNFK